MTGTSSGFWTVTRRLPITLTRKGNRCGPDHGLARLNRTAYQPDANINYIRNSVKATVDAYDGTVKLYAWDESDPVLKTWMKVFPGIIERSLRSRRACSTTSGTREDLFEVQRGLLQRYHVSDPVQFYNGTRSVDGPGDPTVPGAVDQPPYYVLAGADAGTGKAQYQLTSPMKVNNRPNLAAFVTVSSERATMGSSPCFMPSGT